MSTLKAFGAFPEKLVASFCIKILDGLEYLHSNSVSSLYFIFHSKLIYIYPLGRPLRFEGSKYSDDQDWRCEVIGFRCLFEYEA